MSPDACSRLAASDPNYTLLCEEPDYSDGFARDLAKIDRTQSRRILKYLATRINGQPDPRQHGRALTGAELGNLWRYRIGDPRVIADIQDDTCTVLAVTAAHRSTVYR